METNPVIGITIGDPNGIGPEVVLKALCKDNIRRTARFVVISPIAVLIEHARYLQLEESLTIMTATSQLDFHDSEISILDSGFSNDFTSTPGRITQSAGKVAGKALETATQLAMSGDIDALVTAPISKQSFNSAGYDFPGQTEFFAAKFTNAEAVMVLISGTLRVSLATNHCAISKVASLLTKETLMRKLQSLSHDLRIRFGVATPRIAVTALNPHAGEGGLFGREESSIITPAVEAAQNLGLRVAGPFPADTLFAKMRDQEFDAYLAMYHDQGLIPIKMASFGTAVNYTAGLPIIRTSPDHGTAFDIAGKGVANSGSMEEAIKLAVRLAANKKAG